MSTTLAAKSVTEKICNSYEQQFTGFHKITSHEGAQWYIYFMLGRIVWAQSNTHSFRAWRRHIAIHSPALSKQIGDPVSLYYEYWNYAALSRLVRLKQFPRTQFSKIAESYVGDVLFDILQANALQHEQFGDLLIEMQTKEAGNMPFLMLDNIHPWKKARQRWHQWQQAGLVNISPNLAPRIADADVLKKNTPLQTFQTLNSFVDGDTTLRDLAVKVKQPIIPIARSIQPYIAKQLLELTKTSDIVEHANHGFHLELLEEHQLLENANAAHENQEPSEKRPKSASIEKEPATPVTIEKEATEPPCTVLSEPVRQVAIEQKSTQKAPAQKLAQSQPVKNKSGNQKTGKQNASNQKASNQQDKKATHSETKAPAEKLATQASAMQASVARKTVAKQTSVGATSKAVAKQSNQQGRTQHTEKQTKIEKAPAAASKAAEAPSIENKPLETGPAKQITKQVAKQPNNLKTPQPSQKSAALKNHHQPAKTKQPTQNATKSFGKVQRQNNQTRKSALAKIVYVDDSPADSRAMAAIVEKMGYQYLNIPDPLQALPMLIEIRPKMILLDLVMPIANGYEVCTQLRRVTALKKTPIIIVTGNNGIIDRVRAKIVGASGFLGKPIQEPKVLKVLNKHLV